MVGDFFSQRQSWQDLYAGPLGPHVDGFAALLSQDGYSRPYGRAKLRLVADLSRWLERRRVGVADLNEERVREYLQEGSTERCVRRDDRPTLGALLRYLRRNETIPPRAEEIDDSGVGRIQADFAKYLSEERGLSQATLAYYLPLVRKFLCERFGAGPFLPGDIRSSDVTGFVLRQAPTVGPRRSQLMTSALRSFFGFLRLRGDVAADLAACVPSVADWRLSTLPKSLRPDEVERLLAGCDRNSPIGRRDYAVLLLLARLGLRAGEIVAMRLDDIDWVAGKLTVRGKGSRQDMLPIPQDVGEAVATYLRQTRPRCLTRRVFIRIKAPHCGFSGSAGICDIVRRALTRADLDPPRKGAHLLRHSLATDMLRKGASLAEIGEVLRHSLPSTTEIYAKVDLRALRALALPWMGGAS